MRTQILTLLTLVCLVGCATNPPQTQTPPSPPPISVTAPIKKANQAAVDAQKKAQQLEQANPAVQPDPSPSP